MSGISFDFNHSQAVSSYRFAAAQGGRPGRGLGRDCECESSSMEDVLDLGNSRGIAPSAESLMAMLEDKINGRLEAKFAEEKAVPELDDYWSPENTAGRIVNFALKFYEAYNERHGGESEKNLDEFLSLVKGAIGEGIGEAEAVIGEASGGEVPEANKSTIAKTRDHIYKLLEEFRQEALERIRGGDSEKSEEAEAEEEAPEATESFAQV